MKIGKYWDETQVAIIDIESTNYKNGNWGFVAPAIAATVVRNGKIAGLVFIEAVPGSEHVGYYLNPITFTKASGNVVKVNVYDGVDIHSIQLKRHDIWPLEWFGLEKLPPYISPAFSAYDHAMGVVG